MAKYRKVFDALLTIILWLVSLVLGFIDIDFSRKIIGSISLRFWPSQNSYVLIQNVATVILALGFIAFIIVTSEYHRKHTGEAGSWKLFGQTLGVEILIPVIAFFMT